MKGKCMSKTGTSNKLWGTTVTKLRPYDQAHVHGLAELVRDVTCEPCSDANARSCMLTANTVFYGYFHGELMIGCVVVHMGHLAARVTNIMVLSDWRRQGIGSRLLRAVDGALLESQKLVEFYVPEENMAMQLFLRHNLIRATDVMGDRYLFRAEKGYSKKVGDAKSA